MQEKCKKKLEKEEKKKFRKRMAKHETESERERRDSIWYGDHGTLSTEGAEVIKTP